MDRDTDSESRYEKLWNTPAFENKPTRPPREGTTGELVFAGHWERHLADTESATSPPNGALSGILASYPFDLDQRCATVAASLVCWFGTNCGRAFLEQAKNQAKASFNKGDAYLSAWAVENARRSYSGSQARVLEVCLKDDSARGYPELSGRDYEVAEHVVEWLAGPDGQEFLGRCEAEIEKRLPEERLAAFLKDNLSLAPHSVQAVLRMSRDMAAKAVTLS